MLLNLLVSGTTLEQQYMKMILQRYHISYQISYLKGPAKAAMSGILITESNYLEAVEILQKRFGNKQILITSCFPHLQSTTLMK